MTLITQILNQNGISLVFASTCSLAGSGLQFSLRTGMISQLGSNSRRVQLSVCPGHHLDSPDTGGALLPC
jgi:hypothetical protein